MFLVALLAVKCGGVNHGADRTVVGANGYYGTAVDKHYGCEGELLNTQRHKQMGAGASIRHEFRRGGLLGASVGVLRGAPQEYKQEDRHDGNESGPIDMSEYTLVNGSLRLGYDFAYLGGEGGVSIIKLVDGKAAAFPWGRLKAGDMEGTWFEVGFLTPNPLDSVDVFSGGLGVRTDSLRARVGVTFHGRAIRDVTWDQNGGEHKWSLGANAENLDGGVYGELEWVPAGSNVGLSVGGTLSAAPGFRLGLVGLLDP